jgi:dTMP kinase
MFITFEGIDGCGKTTQAKLLTKWLEENGHSVVLTREPGGTEVAEKIRNVILTPTNEELNGIAEILLYASSRAQHVSNLIKPLLESGNIVISDRFYDSSIAFQGYGLGYDRNFIESVNKIAMQGITPDVVFVIDIDPIESERRSIRKNKDRIELRDNNFHTRVREGFLEVASRSIKHYVINGNRSINEIQEEIRQVIGELI